MTNAPRTEPAAPATRWDAPGFLLTCGALGASLIGLCNLLYITTWEMKPMPMRGWIAIGSVLVVAIPALLFALPVGCAVLAGRRGRPLRTLVLWMLVAHAILMLMLDGAVVT